MKGCVIFMLQLYLSMLDDHSYDKNLTEIYKEYKSWMLKVAFYFLKDEGLAADAVHDVFLNIVKKIRNVPLNNPDITKSYLYIAIKNSSINILKNQDKNTTFDIEQQYDICSDTDVIKDVETKDLYDRVLAYINDMPEKYREVLTLHLVCQNSLNEISMLLGIPFKTAQTRYLRGRNMIRERFGDII